MFVHKALINILNYFMKKCSVQIYDKLPCYRKGQVALVNGINTHI